MFSSIHHGTFVRACALAIPLLTACDEVEPETADDGRTEEPVDESSVDIEDGETRVGGERVAEVTLDGGASLDFIGLPDGKGGLVVGVLGRTPSGAVGLADFPIVAGASASEIYWATTEPGTPVPDALAAEVPKLGAQGWLLDVMATTTLHKPRSACASNTSFSATLNSYGYDDHGPAIRLDQEASTSTRFVDYLESFGANWPNGAPHFYKYDINGTDGSVFYNVDRYITMVAVCALGNHPTLESNFGSIMVHPGPDVMFDYRQPGGTSWSNALSRDLLATEAGETISWHFYTGLDWDWRTRVHQAEYGDLFDLGHAAEDI